jgi:hypothetical protein
MKKPLKACYKPTGDYCICEHACCYKIVKYHYYHCRYAGRCSYESKDKTKAVREDFKCDMCGHTFNTIPHPVYDENFNKQCGLKQCDNCFKPNH